MFILDQKILTTGSIRRKNAFGNPRNFAEKLKTLNSALKFELEPSRNGADWVIFTSETQLRKRFKQIKNFF
jgi:hypothetical protein